MADKKEEKKVEAVPQPSPPSAQPQAPAAGPVFQAPQEPLGTRVAQSAMQWLRDIPKSHTPMRFDAYGREQPVLGFDVDKTVEQMDAGRGIPLIKGATLYKPANWAQQMALGERQRASITAERNPAGARTTRKRLRPELSKIPQEEVDLTTAQPVFSQTEIPSRGISDPHTLEVKQSYQVPGQQDPVHVRTYEYEPTSNYVAYAHDNPLLVPTPREQNQTYKQALEYLKSAFGQTEPPSYTPISESRRRLFSRFAPDPHGTPLNWRERIAERRRRGQP